MSEHPTLDRAEMDPLIRTFDYRGLLVEIFIDAPGIATFAVYDLKRGDYLTARDIPLPWGASPANWAGTIMAAIRGLV